MPRPWSPLPHQAFEKLEENLWSIEADLPKGPMKRRMTVARLSDGRLVLGNGIALDDASMLALEGFGEPAFVLAPNGFHRLDLHAYRQRYPKLRILAGEEARARVAQAAQVDGGFELLPKDAGVTVEPIAGMKMGEPVLLVRSPSGRSAAVFPGDTLMNHARVRGVPGLLFSLLGFHGDLRVPRLIKWIGMRSKPALREHLLRIAALPGLAHVVTSHGPVLSTGAVAALRRAAERL